MSAPPVPPGLDIHASQQPQLYAAIITTYLLATISVALRFWSRSLTKAKPGLDDWLILTSLAIAAGFLVSLVVWITQGYGKHLWVLDPHNFLLHLFKNLFVGEILYTLVIVTVKYSVLAFYKRIFDTPTIRIQALFLAGVTTVWGTAVILVTIFQCIPVSGFWDKNIPAKCMVDDYGFFVGIAVPNIVTDALILSMPIPPLLRLHRNFSQKISLIGIFMLGGFVCIVSIVRLVTLVNVDLKSPDLDWNFAQVGIWTATESNIAIVSACLPSLRPILSLITTGSPTAAFRSKSYPVSDVRSKSRIQSESSMTELELSPARSQSDTRRFFPGTATRSGTMDTCYQMNNEARSASKWSTRARLEDYPTGP